jgi:hypothetical protein
MRRTEGEAVVYAALYFVVLVGKATMMHKLAKFKVDVS